MPIFMDDEVPVSIHPAGPQILVALKQGVARKGHY